MVFTSRGKSALAIFVVDLHTARRNHGIIHVHRTSDMFLAKVEG